VGLIFGATEARSQLVPIPLDYQRVGNQIVLSWSNAAFSLQTSPTVHGTFTNLTGATSPYTNALSGAQAYLQLAGANPPAGMALIPAGSFTMGNTFNDGMSIERPLHTVYVSAFYMDRYLVTKALWDTVKNWNGGDSYSYSNAGFGKAANHPVYHIDWYDAVKWCNARSQMEGLVPCYYTDTVHTAVYKTGQMAPYVNWTAGGYRLPTEAEWEKAARGGASAHRFPWSDVDTLSHSRANYQSEGPPWHPYDLSPTRGYHPTFNDGVYPYTSPVGYFAANGYGLYDMAGNLFAWCWDWWADWYWKAEATQADTRGPTSGTYHVVRGGSWSYNGAATTCSSRGNMGAPTEASVHHGFRCVRGL